jgi:hypothetical protein
MTTRGRNMRALLAALIGTVAPLAVLADDHPVVVELFTSQGCSTCPPADAMLAELAHMPGVIALGLHVDYWDYIGWTDTFGHAAYTARQQAYARAARARGVYTPQFIVGGSDAVVGADAIEVMALLRHHAAAETGVDVDIDRTGNTLHITARAEAPAALPMLVQVVRYRPAETVDIGGGENAGHEIAYANIVTSMQRVAEWRGTEPLTLRMEIAGPEPVVVIVQQAGPGPIMAAARAD